MAAHQPSESAGKHSETKTKRASLQSLYTDYLFPSVTAFQKIGKAQGYTPHEIKSFLDTRAEIQVYKQPRAPAREPHYDHGSWNIVLMADLQDFSRWSKQNSGYKWVLNILEFHSGFVWSYALKNKEPSGVAPHIKEVLDSLNEIEYWKAKKVDNTLLSVKLVTDLGSEFKGAVSQLLRGYPSVHRLYAIPGRRKSTAPVERFNGTLLTMLRRYFIGSKTFRWVDVLPKIITIYNETPKRDGKIPAKVLQEGHDTVIDLDKYWRPSLEVGSWVRIINRSDVFDKKSITNKLSYGVHQIVGVKEGMYLVDVATSKDRAAGRQDVQEYMENELSLAAAPSEASSSEATAIVAKTKAIADTNRLERNLTADLGADNVRVKRGKVTAVNILPERQVRDRTATYARLTDLTTKEGHLPAKGHKSVLNQPLVLPPGSKRIRVASKKVAI